jgi:hypothetical protein
MPNLPHGLDPFSKEVVVALLGQLHRLGDVCVVPPEVLNLEQR